MFQSINRDMNSITAIIVAAGRGTRAGNGIPKQYRKIGKKSILHHTINLSEYNYNNDNEDGIRIVDDPEQVSKCVSVLQCVCVRAFQR